ncbi:unnamed protein product [Rotaria sp. Silwood2]|nr:unnamed protein product [Rotaria sp. Silwood2]
MIQVKRYLNNSNPRHEETKKLKTIYDDRERINCLENLSNELFYEIFDYLDGCELFNAFSNLNNRFRTLLNGSSRRLIINLRFHPETIKQYRSTCIVSRNKDRIISLNLANFYCFNSSFTLFNINSSFSHLESLVLGKMKPNELKSLLINLISLPRLFSLIIHYDDDLKQINNIYQMIVKLPMLKQNVIYAKFIREIIHPESQKVCRRDLLFQDNADSKQRIKTVLQIVDELFNHRILPEEDDAKFAYV